MDILGGMLSIKVLQYIAEEVERQGDSPTAVPDMARGWLDAMEMKRGNVVGPVPTLRDIERWGTWVAPQKNMMGFRRGLVSIGGMVKAPWPQYLGDLKYLLKGLAETSLITPENAYREFQMIHPFNDGNGRTGKIFFNYLKGTLLDPVMPPNFFNCSNP